MEKLGLQTLKTLNHREGMEWSIMIKKIFKLGYFGCKQCEESTEEEWVGDETILVI